MKNILGLDLGTNSIGWAIVSVNDDGQYTKNITLGSRIIPMSQDVMSNFDKGVTESSTKERRLYRSSRRLLQRSLLRRERLFRVLHTLGFLPTHFDQAIGWDKTDNKTYGKFKDSGEPKIAWCKDEEGKMRFLFMSSFEEMLADFAEHQPQLVADGKRIPLDWTLYYLRKKALTSPVSREELAWILLSFNQKRGYNQLRGEEEEEAQDKREEYLKLTVKAVEPTGDRKGGRPVYSVQFTNGWRWETSQRIVPEDWTGCEKEFIVTTRLNADGTDKLDSEGNVARTFRAPAEDDWQLLKKRTEMLISTSGLTVGSYIYDKLLFTPNEKMRGNLVRTVERKYYKDELRLILQKQAQYISELTDPQCLEHCLMELYPSNANHRASMAKRDVCHLLIEDVLFYQRPLKSKKSLIGNCPFESRTYVDKTTGEIIKKPLKCTAKSNPYYQEFRLWQFVQNLRLIDNTSINDTDVTSSYIKDEADLLRLFLFLNDRKEVREQDILKGFLGLKKPKGKDTPYPVRWNYVADKAYPCNETRATMLKALSKAGCSPNVISDQKETYRLWHLLYSVEDKAEIVGALTKYATAHNLPDSFVKEFANIPAFKKEYGAYSEKAIKKLLSVMRLGESWSEASVPQSVNRLFASDSSADVPESMMQYTTVSDLHGLTAWEASYAVYGDTQIDTTIWSTPEEMDSAIKAFKQYSLRNPIVEQVVLEALRTVHDIWLNYGHIDEIHVELGRNMKSTAEQRSRDTERILANEATNMRIRLLLEELKNDPSIADVRPYSPMQQSIMRIYEEGALCQLGSDDKDIFAISRKSNPTQAELIRYKLWLEQKYRSPYTGRAISLSKLFTSAYQIEHVIPQSRYFDDSLSNKVICEAEVNQVKGNMLGMEFIKKMGGKTIHSAALGDVKVFTEAEYQEFVDDNYRGCRAKARKLLLEDIPSDFIARQMNDSRYISRTVMTYLSRIVREQDEQGAISKNVIPCSGGVTDRLKKSWGLDDVWNTIVTPRYERMNAITKSSDFGYWDNKDGKRVFQTTMPLELQKGFQKKRIDHRHHAMDALVIALASRSIINYLNNQSALTPALREEQRRSLCSKNREINKPWDTFTQDALNALNNIVVSFKNYTRVINKATNYYSHYNASGRKTLIAQKGGSQWAVRKPLHKDTVFGHVNLREKETVALSKAIDCHADIVYAPLRKTIAAMKQSSMTKKQILAHFKAMDFKLGNKSIAKVEVYYFTDSKAPMVATRKPLDTTFDEKKINTITDSGIRQILLRYLKAKGGDPAIAFSPEGIKALNDNIAAYNNGHAHMPILRVRRAEVMGEKHVVGTSGCNSKKFVEAQGGTNLFYAIYVSEDGARSYATIPLAEAAERLKQGLKPVPERSTNGSVLKFWLSPNDLVYVPSADELDRDVDIAHLDKERIYKFVSATGNRSYFVKHSVASTIVNKVEFDALNKMERDLNETMVKTCCWKLIVDRLGRITQIIK